jgi:hypothetical protein
MDGLTLVFMIMKQQRQFQMKNGNKMNYENNLQRRYQINKLLLIKK